MAEGKGNVGTYLLIILVILIIDIVGGYMIGIQLVKYVYNIEEEKPDDEGPIAGASLGSVSPSSLYVEENSDAVAKAIEEKLALNDTEPGQVIQLDDIILNPAQSEGEFFTCKVYVEFAPKSDKAIEEFNKRLARIQAAIFSYLSEKTVDQLSNDENWDEFRTKMLDFVLKAMPVDMHESITNLYVTQRLIQY